MYIAKVELWILYKYRYSYLYDRVLVRHCHVARVTAPPPREKTKRAMKTTTHAHALCRLDASALVLARRNRGKRANASPPAMPLVSSSSSSRSRSTIGFDRRPRQPPLPSSRAAAAADATASTTAATTDDDEKRNNTPYYYQGVDCNGVELDDFERFVMEMQASVCSDMEALDGGEGAQFSTDAWTREGRGSGFGVTRVLEGGDVFEKAAANVSIIRGVLTPERARAMSSRVSSFHTHVFFFWVPFHVPDPVSPSRNPHDS